MGFDIQSILIYGGLAGLAITGIFKAYGPVAQWFPSKAATGDLVAITRAYATLHAALLANGSAVAADRLRIEILPYAVKPPEPKE